MKKLVIILFVLITSCYSTKFKHYGDTNAIMDFSKGRWLLNTIDAPANVKNELTQIADQEFLKFIGDDKRFSLRHKTNGLVFTNNISDADDIDKSTLKDIKNGSNFDFFIHISAKNNAQEISGGIQLIDIESPVKNSGEVILSVYDLNLLEKVYSQSAIGTVVVQNETSNYILIKNTNEIITKALVRILRKIEKKQINSGVN